MPDRPAEIAGRQPAGPRLGYQGPDQGYVLIYSFPTDAAAATAGAELARYVASGFGQTNYPTDAQFSVAQVGSTLVFTWYSGARANDPAAVRGAFDAIRSVGQPFPVVK